MTYVNNNDRTLYESILNINVLHALKSLKKNNILDDIILINNLAIGHHHKPMMGRTIDVLAADKNIKFKYFPNNSYYKNGVNINIYDIEYFNITHADYIDIKNNSFVSDGFNIISPTYMIILNLKKNGCDIDTRVNISKLSDNSKIDIKLINSFFNIYNIKENIKKNNRDYMLKYLKSYSKYNTCRIYEGNSGYPEVDAAFNDWIKNTTNYNQVLIGGMALLTHSINRDRTTQDVDFLFLSREDIPGEVYGFKRHRNNAYQHSKTHVEIETLTSDTINVLPEIVELVFKNSYIKDGYRIASPSSIVALKLGRFTDIDEKDIISLIDNYDINIDEFKPYLSEIALENWNYILSNI